MFGYLNEIFKRLGLVEKKIRLNSRFSQSELLEIMNLCKSENIPYLQELVKIEKLTNFDISFLMANVDLSPKKIEVLKEAIGLYDPDDFKGMGQTFSDYIFRVASNIDILTMENLPVFKELVQCKNEIYDFKTFLKTPKNLTIKTRREAAFAFERVLY